MEIRPSINKTIGGGGVSILHGDKFRPSDYVLDQLYNLGRISDLIEFTVKTPSIFSGLVISQGVGDTISVSAGNGIVKKQAFDVTIRNYDGTDVSTVAIPKMYLFASFSGVANFLIPSAILDGTTWNYVKARYKVKPLVIRNYNYNPPASYPIVVLDDLEIVVDSTGPAEFDIDLGRFKGVPSGIFTVESSKSSANVSVLSLKLNLQDSEVFNFGNPLGMYELLVSNGDSIRVYIGNSKFLVEVDDSTKYSDVANTLGKINCYLDSGNFIIQNLSGSFKSFKVYNHL